MTAPAIFLLLATLLVWPAAVAAGAGRVGDGRAEAGPAGAGRSGAAPALGKYTDTLSFRVTRVDPLIAGPADHLLTVVAEMTNTGRDPVDDFGYRFQRGDALDSIADLRAELADPGQPVAVINSPFTELPGELAPGATRSVTFEVPIAGDPDGTLAVTEPGVYPVMVNVNGTVHTEAGHTRARVGELHLTLPVASPPGSEPAGQAVGLDVIWPITSTPHLAVNGVFRTDELADEIAPGGRLDAVLSALEQAPAARFVTLAVDPMLLDELDRMSRGYRVLTDREITQRQLTPDTAEPGPPETTDDAPATTGAIPAETPTQEHTVPGTGSAQAIAFLARLRLLAATRPTVVLPYGDADITALARAGQDQAIATAVLRGRGVASRVLGQSVTATGINPDGTASTLITTMALPPGGAITTAAWRELAALGYTSVVLDPAAVKPRSARGSVLLTDLAADPIPAVVTGPDKTVTDLLLSGTPAGWQQDLPELAATLALDPPTADIVILPARDFRPSPDGLATLASLAADLTAAGLLTPAETRRIAAVFGGFGGYTTGSEESASESPPHSDGATSEKSPGTTSETSPAATGTAPQVESRYPDSARKQELPAAYLDQLATLRTDLAVMSTSLDQGDAGPDPADILTPLADTLLPATSASLRGDPGTYAHTLATVTDTLATLYAGVTVQRDTGRYTLASTTAPLILTLRNTLPYQVTVTVSIERGAQLGLTATDPGNIVIDAGPRTAAVKIDTTVTRSGTFVVDAQLRDRYGATWGQAVPLTIDSRAYGPLTIILMISAAGVLVLMVIWRLIQRLRGKSGAPGDALAPPETGERYDDPREGGIRQQQPDPAGES